MFKKKNRYPEAEWEEAASKGREIHVKKEQKINCLEKELKEIEYKLYAVRTEVNHKDDFIRRLVQDLYEIQNGSKSVLRDYQKEFERLGSNDEDIIESFIKENQKISHPGILTAGMGIIPAIRKHYL